MLETLRFRQYAHYFNRLIIKGVILSLVWCNCNRADETARETLSIFAAASLKPSLDQIVPLFEDEHQIELVISYAGSGALARQIEYGAPIDIFMSANEAWVRHLEDKGLMRDITGFFSNSLVLIENSNRDVGHPFEMTREWITNRLGNGAIALGNVSSVPAGIYAKAAFETSGVWKDIQTKVAQTDAVRAALRLVELGEASMAVVYGSDVIGSAEVRVLYEFQGASHPEIIYFGGRLRGSVNEMADLFLNFLTQEAILKMFYSRGFLPLN